MPTGLTPQGVIATRNEVWDVALLTWVPETQSGGAGGTVDQGTGGSSPWLVTGPLTNTQLRAAPVVISGAVVTI